MTTARLGFVIGSGDVVDWIGFAWTTAGTMMAACLANAFSVTIGAKTTPLEFKENAVEA